MEYVKSTVLVCISLLMFSCSSSTTELSPAEAATEAYANTIKIAETMVAGTAEFESKLQLAIQQTATAMPTNTYTPTPTNTATSTPTFTPTATATYTPTMTASFTATNTSTPTITPSPTYTPSPVPTNTSIPSPTEISTATSIPSRTIESSAGTISNIHVNGNGPTFIEVEYDYVWSSDIPDWWLIRGAQGNLHGDVYLYFINQDTGVERVWDDYLVLRETRAGTLTKAYGVDKICKGIWYSGKYKMTDIGVKLSTSYQPAEQMTSIPGSGSIYTADKYYRQITTAIIPYTDWEFTCP